VFEELIRKFAEISNETAGEHFTPREVIRLMVNLIFIEDDDVLAKPGVVRTMYDPTAGTGGMLSVAGEYLAEHNPQARLTVFGQELNPESYAICKADMLIKGQDVANIAFGNTLSDDGHPHKKFDYMLSNPPFGVEWKKVEKEVRKEHEQRASTAASAPACPACRTAPCCSCCTCSARCARRWRAAAASASCSTARPCSPAARAVARARSAATCWRTTWCEAIVGLPTDMFYNTGISTYVWIISNRKPEARKGKVQLIDASGMWQKMRKSLGSKRKELSDAHIDHITRLFGDFEEARDTTASPSAASSTTRRLATTPSPWSARCAMPRARWCWARRASKRASPSPTRPARHRERALTEDVGDYFKREVLPHAPDAWIDPTRPRWATRSRSTGTSTCSSRRARWQRSTPT
jgi:type I restriction enzyme M protein